MKADLLFFSFLGALLAFLVGSLFGGLYGISLITEYYLPVATSYFWQGMLIVFLTAALFAASNFWLKANLSSLVRNEGHLMLLGALFLIASYLLTFNTTSYQIFPYVEMNGFFYTLVSMALLGPIAAVSAFLILDLVTVIKNKVSGGATLTGIGASLFSLGCPTCGALLYSVLGLGGGLSILPLKGIEFKLLSLALLGYALYAIYKSVKFSNEEFRLPEEKQNESAESELSLNMFATASLLLLLPVLGFVQLQLNDLGEAFGTPSLASPSKVSVASSVSLNDVDVYSISSTPEALLAVFPELRSASSEEDVVSVLLPGGTPEYSQALGGITFEDPVNSLQYLSRWYFSLKKDVQENDPQTWNRYLKLAAAPRGISCEFCCGVGPQGIDGQGNIRCGCSHNLALQALTLGLMKYTDYSDAEILREVMKWKTIFFPKNMVSLGASLAGKDPSQIKTLPGMVGGC